MSKRRMKLASIGQVGNVDHDVLNYLIRELIIEILENGKRKAKELCQTLLLGLQESVEKNTQLKKEQTLKKPSLLLTNIRRFLSTKYLKIKKHTSYQKPHRKEELEFKGHIFKGYLLKNYCGIRI